MAAVHGPDPLEGLQFCQRTLVIHGRHAVRIEGAAFNTCRKCPYIADLRTGKSASAQAVFADDERRLRRQRINIVNTALPDRLCACHRNLLFDNDAKERLEAAGPLPDITARQSPLERARGQDRFPRAVYRRGTYQRIRQ